MVLFNGIEKVSDEEVIRKMNYFIDKAEEAMELYEADKTDKAASLAMAKSIRSELKLEYNNNELTRIARIYKDHELFSHYYRHAVHEAMVSVTANLSYKKLYGFLYDVGSYMRYYIPKQFENEE